MTAAVAVVVGAPVGMTTGSYDYGKGGISFLSELVIDVDDVSNPATLTIPVPQCHKCVHLYDHYHPENQSLSHYCLSLYFQVDLTLHWETVVESDGGDDYDDENDDSGGSEDCEMAARYLLRVYVIAL